MSVYEKKLTQKRQEIKTMEEVKMWNIFTKNQKGKTSMYFSSNLGGYQVQVQFG